MRALRGLCKNDPKDGNTMPTFKGCGKNHKNVDMAYMAGMVTANTENGLCGMEPSIVYYLTHSYSDVYQLGLSEQVVVRHCKPVKPHVLVDWRCVLCFVPAKERAESYISHEVGREERKQEDPTNLKKIPINPIGSASNACWPVLVGPKDAVCGVSFKFHSY